jgi:hypothetical protein
MTRANRYAAVLVVLAAGLVLGVGCGTQSGCANVTPDVNQAPTSCSLLPSTPVTVSVRWCTCGASVTCDALPESGGVIQLEPKVSSCDASCPANPTACPFDSVTCSFTSPAAGSYNLYVISGQSFQSVPLTVSDSGSASCT